MICYDVYIRDFNAWTLRRLLTMAGFECIEVGVYLRGSIWDMFQVINPLHHITIADWQWLSPALHLGYQADLPPCVFAERHRAIVYMPAA